MQNAAKVLVITVFDDSATVLNSVRVGASGYLLKDAQPSTLVSAIHTVVSGGAPLSAAIARHLTDALQATEAARVVTSINLTNREQEILQLFATALSYRQVASELHISRHTVGDFVKSIYTKLNVNSRGEAVYEAVKLKLIDMQP